jgi:hypothetical protein
MNRKWRWHHVDSCDKPGHDAEVSHISESTRIGGPGNGNLGKEVRLRKQASWPRPDCDQGLSRYPRRSTHRIVRERGKGESFVPCKTLPARRSMSPRL